MASPGNQHFAILYRHTFVAYRLFIGSARCFSGAAVDVA